MGSDRGRRDQGRSDRQACSDRQAGRDRGAGGDRGAGSGHDGWRGSAGRNPPVAWKQPVLMRARSKRAVYVLVAMVVAGLGAAGCGSSAPQTDRAPSWQGAPPVSPSVTAGVTSAAPSAPAGQALPSTAASKPVTYAFPVFGKSWYAHTHHDYPATDIITKCGNAVVAATSGVILEVTRKDSW